MEKDAEKASSITTQWFAQYADYELQPLVEKIAEALQAAEIEGRMKQAASSSHKVVIDEAFKRGLERARQIVINSKPSDNCSIAEAIRKEMEGGWE